MSIESRGGARKRRKRPKVNYFFLNSELHRVLRVITGEDFVEAWNYPQGKRVGYVWSDTRKHMEKAFPLSKVGEMIGRTRVQLMNYVKEGGIITPQRAYTLDGEKKPGKYLFSESDVLALHDYMMTIHVGRPRKDGRITPPQIPSKAELRAMMRHDTMLYLKSSDGELRPVYKEIDW